MSNAFNSNTGRESESLDPVLQQRQERLAFRARLAYFLKRGGVWVALFVTMLATTIVVAGVAEGYNVVTGLGFAWPWEWLGRLDASSEVAINRWTGAALSIFAGTWLTLAGLWALKRFLNLAGRGILSGQMAIARQSIDEAVRNKTVVILLVILVLALSLQPFFNLGQIDQALRYRIQTYLSYSVILANLLLGAVTVLFCAFTVHGDLFVRRTGDVFVKPISRAGYLLGKWIGAISLMLVMMAVWTVMVIGGARLWLQPQFAMDPQDRELVTTRVLVGRETAAPLPDQPFAVQLDQAMEEVVRTAPQRIQRAGLANVRSDELNKLRNQFLQIPYLGNRTYIYSGLSEVRQRALDLEERIFNDRDRIVARLTELGAENVRPDDITLLNLLPYADILDLYDLSPGMLQLRFKLKGVNTFGTSERDIIMVLNGQQLSRKFIIDRVERIDIPASLIDEEGQLEMVLAYPPRRDAQGNRIERAGQLQFDSETWLLLFYSQGDFGPNVGRAAFIIWIRLVFLAMLATVTGALFTYPVAATFSLTFWLLAGLANWVQQTAFTRVDGTGSEVVNTALDDFIQPVVAWIAGLFTRFSFYNISGLLTDGRNINYTMLLNHFLYVGLGWTGAAFLIGWYFFSRREIARVQV